MPVNRNTLGVGYVNVTQAAEILGISRQRLYTLRGRRGYTGDELFPAPAGFTRGGISPYWDYNDIVQYKLVRNTTPGRPTKKKEVVVADGTPAIEATIHAEVAEVVPDVVVTDGPYRITITNTPTTTTYTASGAVYTSDLYNPVFPDPIARADHIHTNAYPRRGVADNRSVIEHYEEWANNTDN